MTATVQRHGRYALFETPRENRILTLGSDLWFAWVKGDQGDLLVRSDEDHERARTIVSGDTTGHAKPHPEPLLHAARKLGVPPGRCVYVGDDLRDVQAGIAAGMPTLVARWGYLGNGEPPERWPATGGADRPLDVLEWLPAGR